MIYLLGADGFVGSCLEQQLRDSDMSYKATTRESLDITDEVARAAFFENMQPGDVVVLAAAAPNVDWCETHPHESAAVNRDAPEAIAALCQKYGARLLFFSSEYVFDGLTGPYDERAPAHPINIYGQHKLAAEQAIQKACSDSLIIRTTTVYGYEQTRKNFLMSFIDRVRSGTEVLVPEDQVSTPTFVEDLARITVALAARPDSAGILNVTGAELMPRTVLAAHVSAIFNLPTTSWRSVSTRELKQTARRPLRAGLSTRKLHMLGYDTLPVTVALENIKTRYGHLI